MEIKKISITRGEDSSPFTEMLVNTINDLIDKTNDHDNLLNEKEK